jgi:hypothetical protein
LVVRSISAVVKGRRQARRPNPATNLLKQVLSSAFAGVQSASAPLRKVASAK